MAKVDGQLRSVDAVRSGCDIGCTLSPAATAGQHTDEILRGLGHTGEAIAALRSDDII
jgi:crotonobetainyl-CoA:carnitine CoA-transferase CaiB-like acyl-CoA transferase